MDINFSYDYEDLIEEFKFDCLAFGISENDKIRVIREIRADLDIYYPIVDYFFENEKIEEDDLFEGAVLEYMTAKSVLEEMEKYNSIFN